MTDSTILVLGARGKTGSRVVARLNELGRPVRAASRTTGFDLGDPATWDAALKDVEAVYLVPMNEHVDQSVVAEFVRRAEGRRIVLLSARGKDGRVQPLQEPVERAVRETATEWTILRPTWFNQNFTEDFLLEPVQGGELALPTGEGREAWIDVRDIADVAVAALTEDGHAGQIYELSGPEALTFGEIAAMISEATGRELRYTALDREAYRTVLAEQGLPTGLVEALDGLMADIRESAGARLSDGVQRVLGREPRTFAAYAKEAAATGAWS